MLLTFQPKCIGIIYSDSKLFVETLNIIMPHINSYKSYKHVSINTYIFRDYPVGVSLFRQMSINLNAINFRNMELNTLKMNMTELIG